MEGTCSLSNGVYGERVKFMTCKRICHDDNTRLLELFNDYNQRFVWSENTKVLSKYYLAFSSLLVCWDDSWIGL